VPLCAPVRSGNLSSPGDKSATSGPVWPAWRLVRTDSYTRTVEPRTEYARIGNRRIGYKVLGDGPIDLVGSFGSFSSIDGIWGLPEAAHPYEQLASGSRLIIFDRLGTGSSDPVPIDALPPLESRWMEIEAVMDAVGSESAVIFGQQDGGPPAMYGAATAPERVLGLITFHSPAKFMLDSDYPMGMDPAGFGEWQPLIDDWDADPLIRISFPSVGDDERFLAWGRRYMRALAGPTAMFAYTTEMLATDVRSLLPSIKVPTLVIHRRDYQWSTPELDRYVADNVDGARYLEVPGGDAALYFSDSAPIVKAVHGFIREIDPEGAQIIPTTRVMATVLFTDIVQSTEKALEEGDAEWRRLLQLHDDIAANVVERHMGRLVKGTGDGILATFDGPGRGLQAAIEIRSRLRRSGLEIRCGLHTGEIDLRGDDVTGIGVHIAARVMAEAGPGEVLASRTVRDLVFGSEFGFEDRGAHQLKGVEGDWDLVALI